MKWRRCSCSWNITRALFSAEFFLMGTGSTLPPATLYRTTGRNAYETYGANAPPPEHRDSKHERQTYTHRKYVTRIKNRQSRGFQYMGVYHPGLYLLRSTSSPLADLPHTAYPWPTSTPSITSPPSSWHRTGRDYSRLCRAGKRMVCTAA